MFRFMMNTEAKLDLKFEKYLCFIIEAGIKQQFPKRVKWGLKILDIL